MRFRVYPVVFALLSSNSAFAAECPSDGVCLNAEQKKKVTDAVLELKDIHESPAVLEVKEPIVIIQDWQNRIYINGGEKKPIRVKLKIGKSVDRDLDVTLDTKVYYRPKPPEPDPFFRLRIKAHTGFIVYDAYHALADKDGRKYLDFGIAWEICHVNAANFSVYTGIGSSGLGIGWDLTRNFGVSSNLVVKYDGFKLGALLGLYFSFN
jgi:hypothetical protein